MMDDVPACEEDVEGCHVVGDEDMVGWDEVEVVEEVCEEVGHAEF